MPPLLGKIISYDNNRVISATVGATALREGALVKFDTALAVPLVDNDKQIRVFVALHDAAIGAEIALVPLADCKLRIAYTGSPAVGASYGVSDAYTLDAADATNFLLTVVKVGGDLDSGFAEVIEYQLAA